MKLFVQISQLLQEPGVGRDVPVGAYSFEGVHQRHVPVDHEVGQHQGGRAAEAHRAVDKHFTYRSAETQDQPGAQPTSAGSTSVFTTAQQPDYCAELYSNCLICCSFVD